MIKSMKKYIFGIIVIMFASIFATPAMADENPYHYNYNRILKHGSGGNDVVMAKFCLARVHNDYYDIHGYFDTATKGRVAAFQRANNLDVDGIIGNKTGAAMEAVCNGMLDTQKTVSEHTQTAPHAGLEFTFSLKNNGKKLMTFEGMKSFNFNVDGKIMTGDVLSLTTGYDLKMTANDARIYAQKKITLKPGEKISFRALVVIDADILKKAGQSYAVTLQDIDWRLDGVRKKPVVVNSVSEPIINANV